jgi:hypothetical protein
LAYPAAVRTGQLSPGALFAGDFEIVAPLGEGGMGAVYVARQRSTGAERALKLMHPDLVRSPSLREKFEQEARIGARIESDHVASVLSAGVDPVSGAPWIAMELLRGETLAFRLERGGPMPWAELVRVYGQMGHALQAAHRLGIVHRDLKPENVFLAAPRVAGVDMMVKVLDFGIAKVVAESQTTMTGAIGTPAYMAPEQYQGRGIGPETDVWALGLMAFHLLTGRSYWRNAGGNTSGPASLMFEACSEPLVAASVRAAELGVGHLLPPGFDAWFAGCVARDPRERFHGAGDAVAAMRTGLPPAPVAGAVGPAGTIVGAPVTTTMVPPTMREGAPAPLVPAYAPRASAPVPSRASPGPSGRVLALGAAAVVVLGVCVAGAVRALGDGGADDVPPLVSVPRTAKPPVVPSEKPAVVEVAPPPPPSAPRRSPKPSAADWAVVGEITVTGSSALSCETKLIREWLRVACRGANEGGGTPTDVVVLRGGGVDVETWAANQATTLLMPYVEGTNLEAKFSWTNRSERLLLWWPRGAPIPPVKGRFAPE